VPKPLDRPATRRILVSDSGPLIVFAIAELLPLLSQLRGPLIAPSAVLHECLARPAKPGVREIQEALRQGFLVEIQSDAALLEPHRTVTEHPEALPSFVGLGEGEIAVLSICKKYDYIALIDEVRARKVAQLMGVELVGSGGLLLELKRAGVLAAIKPVLEIWARHDYFIAQSVRHSLLRLAQEKSS
jgi:uncharacterized protein